MPVYVFCEDVAASGGYWIACAGDEVYANENSIVGSIGVISASFGFEELIAKIGENISVRRIASVASDGPLGHYTHGA